MLSIITDLFGPIFAKEMVEMARRWRYYQNRIFFGVILLLVLYIVYNSSLHYYYQQAGGWSLATLSKMAEYFFLSYLWVQFFAVFLFVPFFLTGVISGEREQKTLDLLFTTQLANREIVFGKLGSRVVSMIMLILSGIPIVSMTMLFGGVNPHTFSQAMICTAMALLYTSSMSIYFSTTTKTTIGALVRTYWWMFCWIFVVPLLALMVLQSIYYLTGASGNTSVFEFFAAVFYLLNPIAPFVVSVNDLLSRQIQTMLGSGYLYWMMLAPTLWSLLMIFLAIRNVRRDPGPSQFMTRLRNFFSILLLKPVTSRVMKQLPATKADRMLGFPVENPLWQRARRAFVYDRDLHVQRVQVGGWILLIVVMILMAVLEPSTYRNREAAIVFSVWVWLGLAILASLLSGLSIVNDRRRGFFEFVLVTPMTSLEVIKGTFLAVWRHMKKTYFLLLVLMTFFVLTGSVSLDRAVASLLIGTLTVALMVLVGIGCSLTARSVAGGLIASFLFPITILLLVPLLNALFYPSGMIALWGICIVMTPLCLVWTMFRKNSLTVPLLLIFVHLSLVCLFTCWVSMFGSDQSPLTSIHPGYMTLETLDGEQNFGGGFLGSDGWQIAKVAYCLALILNFVWLFWWLCRHYEVLSGRKESVRKIRARHPI